MGKEKNIAKNKDRKGIATTNDVAGLGFGGLAVNDDDVSAADMYPALKCFQGTPQEREEFGDMAPGTFYENIEGTPYGESVFVAPVLAVASWSRWNRDSRIPDYVVYSRSEVPPADLDWGPDGEPPAAAKAINVLCFVGVEKSRAAEMNITDTVEDGDIVWIRTPHLVVFRRTGLAAHRKVMMRIEARRTARGAGPGVYRLSSERERNTAGQPYHRLTLVSTGGGLVDHPPLVALAGAIKPELESVRERMIATASAEAHAGVDTSDSDDGDTGACAGVEPGEDAAVPF